IGRGALERQQVTGVPRVMVGAVLDDKGVLRHGQAVSTAVGDGEILSGGFAPTLGKSIGFARVPAGGTGTAHVDIRGRKLPIRIVKYPFVRDGRPCEGI
ncbi:MAG TPA: glycine cleavage T C-terminal barrel domain-containing protein, partial [Oleiagrimonas sp.]|nr:glycine cleavage T C-terminal barrel domain-containing protein [Oleiagrimonas sp.]